jgi:hypothetical protein
LSEDILTASKFLLSFAMRGGLPAIFVTCNDASDLIKPVAELRASNAHHHQAANSFVEQRRLMAAALVHGDVRRYLYAAKMA